MLESLRVSNHIGNGFGIKHNAFCHSFFDSSDFDCSDRKVFGKNADDGTPLIDGEATMLKQDETLRPF